MTVNLKTTGHSPRILIVDDDRQNRDVLVAMLSTEGFEIVTAAGGAEAIAMVDLEAPDLILMDVIMPGMDGHAVTRWIKGNRTTKNIPVIMVTARGDREVRLKGLESGAEDFLSKPVDRAELRVRVRNLLRLKSYGDFYGSYSETLESEVSARTAELQASEVFLRSTIDALPFHVGIMGPDGQMLALNETWKRFSVENGWTRENFATPINYLSVCDSGSAHCPEAGVAARGIRSVVTGEAAEFHMEYPCHSPKENRWFTMRVTPFDSARPASVAITHLNVTERKHMETQLLHKQKLESMGQLAGGVAHDFNNILTVIKSYGDLLLDDLALDASQRKDVEEIGRAADRATNLTRQLLAFSRKETVSPRVFDLNKQLHNVQSMLARLIGEDVQLVVTLDHRQLPINIDPMHLEQAVMNLVVNARDAMPRGGKLTLGTRVAHLQPGSEDLRLDLQPGSYVVLSVTDTGMGMESATMARVFEPFFTTKAEGKGTGLGLSTVFGIVSQANGSVRVSSVPGVGTFFQLYFPLAEMPVEDLRVPEKIAEPQESGRARVLFVEDEAVLRKLGLRVLVKQGYHVKTAADCNEAISICSQTAMPFDIACIDVVMPGMGGGELAVLLLDKYPAMKVIMMSGFNDDDLLRGGIGDKSVPFLQKPYTPAALIAKILEVLQDRAAQASPYLRLA